MIIIYIVLLILYRYYPLSRVFDLGMSELQKTSSRDLEGLMRCMALKILKITWYELHKCVCVCVHKKELDDSVCVHDENIWETGGESVRDERVCVCVCVCVCARA